MTATLMTPQELETGRAGLLALRAGARARAARAGRDARPRRDRARRARPPAARRRCPGSARPSSSRRSRALLGLSFRRVQFTPDLLPGDITGSPILQDQGGRRRSSSSPGPLFANLVLADEINRASPKTQSALLEAMQERRVTVLGETHPLPDAVLRARDAEPDRARGHLPAARGAARPLPVQGRRARRRRRDADAHPPRASARSAAPARARAVRRGARRRVRDRRPRVPARARRVVHRADRRRDAPRGPERVGRRQALRALRRVARARRSRSRSRPGRAALLAGRPNVDFADVETVSVPAAGAPPRARPRAHASTASRPRRSSRACARPSTRSGAGCPWRSREPTVRARGPDRPARRPRRRCGAVGSRRRRGEVSRARDRRTPADPGYVRWGPPPGTAGGWGWALLQLENSESVPRTAFVSLNSTDGQFSVQAPRPDPGRRERPGLAPRPREHRGRHGPERGGPGPRRWRREPVARRHRSRRRSWAASATRSRR